MPWVKSMDTIALAENVRLFTEGEVLVSENVEDAVRIAVGITGGGEKQGIVCIAGSLYLVGNVLKLVRDGGSKERKHRA